MTVMTDNHFKVKKKKKVQYKTTLTLPVEISSQIQCGYSMLKFPVRFSVVILIVYIPFGMISILSPFLGLCLVL